MRIDHINIVVQDMERSIAFYGGLLGMEQTFDTMLDGEWIDKVTGLAHLQARCVFFSLRGQDMRIELLQYFKPR